MQMAPCEPIADAALDLIFNQSLPQCALVYTVFDGQSLWKTLVPVHYTASRRGQKLSLKNSPPKFGPLGPLDPFAKCFRPLGLHLLFPPEHGFRQGGRVHHTTAPKSSSLLSGI